jgi:hypothetical protein
MQSDLIAKVNVLQREGLDAKTRLGSLQISHADQMSEHERILTAKDTTIEEQNLKMAYMTSEFEGMLNVNIMTDRRKLCLR